MLTGRLRIRRRWENASAFSIASLATRLDQALGVAFSILGHTRFRPTPVGSLPKAASMDWPLIGLFLESLSDEELVGRTARLKRAISAYVRPVRHPMCRRCRRCRSSSLCLRPARKASISTRMEDARRTMCAGTTRSAAARRSVRGAARGRFPTTTGRPARRANTQSRRRRARAQPTHAAWTRPTTAPYRSCGPTKTGSRSNAVWLSSASTTRSNIHRLHGSNRPRATHAESASCSHTRHLAGLATARIPATWRRSTRTRTS